VTRTSGLPVADAPLLERAARRERLLRAGLTGALALLVGAAVVLAARSRDGSVPAVAASGRTTELVLDVSGSITGPSYTIVSQTLRRLAGGSAPVGLVLFSDTAEEALPPGSPPSQLRPFADVFAAPGHSRPGELGAIGQPTDVPSPWSESFVGGTRISAGVAAAREALQRDRVRGGILVITDLGDPPTDRPALKNELVRVARAGIPLQVLALPTAYPRDRVWFGRLEGRSSLRATPPPPPARRPGAARPGFPAALAAVAVLLALVLAANELLGVSLRWRGTR
jgi:hypothetical protein